MDLGIGCYLLSPRLDSELLGVLKTSIPLVVLELLVSLYSLIDTYFVSGLGEEALAALGISSYILMLILTFNILLTTPMLIYLSQSIGAKKYAMARYLAGGFMAYGYVITLLLSILWFTTSEYIVSIQSGASGLVLEYTIDYLKIRITGFTVLFTTMALDTVIIASGKTMYSAISNTTGLVLNTILDPLLIYGYLGFPRLGVVGAAIATVISNTFVIPFQLYYISKLGLLPRFNLEAGLLKKLIELGLPPLAERLVFALGNNIYAGVISRQGSIAMAAHNIGLRIESMIYLPGFAFSTTASTLVGRYIGIGDVEKARDVGWRVVKIGSGVMGLLGVLIGLTGYYITQFFSPSEDIRALASIYLLLAGFSEFGLGLAMVTSGAIRGSGNTRIPMIINALSLVSTRITLSIILVKPLGVIGPWIAMFIDVYTRGIILALVYKRLFHRIYRRLI